MQSANLTSDFLKPVQAKQQSGDESPKQRNMSSPIPSTSILSLVRQNFSDACEHAINEQINLELYASYVYLAISQNFARADVALKGFHNFFKKQSHEEREHAELLLDYLNERGGSVSFKDIKAPLKCDYRSGLDAFKAALQLERDVNESLLKLHSLASDKKDPHLTSFIEEHFLNEQVESIKKLADYITNLERATSNEYQFDKLSLSN